MKKTTEACMKCVACNYLSSGPAEYLDSKCNDHDETSAREVKISLSNDKADSEQDVTCWQERQEN